MAGILALALGALGILLPLLPTVPFMILAAFCFARSNPRLEAWLVEHPYFGAHISAWRGRRAINRRGKWAATIGFAFSTALSLWLVPWPWLVITPIVAIVGGLWIWSRPDA